MTFLSETRQPEVRSFSLQNTLILPCLYCRESLLLKTRFARKFKQTDFPRMKKAHFRLTSDTQKLTNAKTPTQKQLTAIRHNINPHPQLLWRKDMGIYSVEERLPLHSNKVSAINVSLETVLYEAVIRVAFLEGKVPREPK